MREIAVKIGFKLMQMSNGGLSKSVGDKKDEKAENKPRIKG